MLFPLFAAILPRIIFCFAFVSVEFAKPATPMLFQVFAAQTPKQLLLSLRRSTLSFPAIRNPHLGY
jgi:hypothetical protein